MHWILHVDLDQFLAAVEILRRPDLRGRPVVVGGSGDPTQRRMVVSTASYEARAFGIRSGMPLRAAARRCQDAVFLATDPPTYERASAQVMATLRRFPVQVEVWGWDEAYVGATTVDPEALAADLQGAVLAATQLWCSIGIGTNKSQAKLATGFAKPAGIFRLTAENWNEVMDARPVEALGGIGRRTAAKLAELDVHTVAELATADVGALSARFGPRTGPWYQQCAQGLGDTRIVTSPRAPRSRSRSVTFPEDLTARADIDVELARLAHRVANEAVAAGQLVHRVAVTLRTSSFWTRTRMLTLPAATTDLDQVEGATRNLLDRFELDRPVRLLGVRVDLTDRS